MLAIKKYHWHITCGKADWYFFLIPRGIITFFFLPARKEVQRKYGESNIEEISYE
jgi:hypothetical protein